MSTNPRLWSTMMMLTVLVILTSSCTEFAMLSSGATIAVSQSAYAKAYSGVDVLTIISTEKDIKTHVYDRLAERNPPSGSGSFRNPDGSGSPHPYPPSGCVSERERDERQ